MATKENPDSRHLRTSRFSENGSCGRKLQAIPIAEVEDCVRIVHRAWIGNAREPAYREIVAQKDKSFLQ